MAVHYIIQGRIAYDESRAVLSCGEDKELADLFAMQLNDLIAKPGTPLDKRKTIETWQESWSIEGMTTNVYDNYEVEEVVVAARS